MNEAKVFVTQVPTRRDHNTGDFVPTIDISPAAEHGEVQIMLPSNYAVFAANDMVRDLRKALSAYDFNQGDSIVALGDPALQAAAVAVLVERNKVFRLLRWDRRLGRYTTFIINLNA